MSGSSMEKDPWGGMDPSLCSEDTYILMPLSLYRKYLRRRCVVRFVWVFFLSVVRPGHSCSICSIKYPLWIITEYWLEETSREPSTQIFQVESAQVSLLRAVPKWKISKDYLHRLCRCYLYLYCPHGEKHFPFSTAPLFSTYSCWTWENKRQRACHVLDDLLVGADRLLLKSSLLPDLSQGALAPVSWLLICWTPCTILIPFLFRGAPSCKE